MWECKVKSFSPRGKGIRKENDQLIKVGSHLRFSKLILIMLLFLKNPLNSFLNIFPWNNSHFSYPGIVCGGRFKFPLRKALVNCFLLPKDCLENWANVNKLFSPCKMFTCSMINLLRLSELSFSDSPRTLVCKYLQWATVKSSRQWTCVLISYDVCTA